VLQLVWNEWQQHVFEILGFLFLSDLYNIVICICNVWLLGRVLLNDWLIDWFHFNVVVLLRARDWHVCAGARSFEVRLNCSLIAGRFVYEPLSYWNYRKRAADALQIGLRRRENEYAARLQYSGVSQCQASLTLMSSQRARSVSK